MQLTCPHCDNIVPAEQVNIQKLVAVCPHCDTIFGFEAPNILATSAKEKRRKIKKPSPITQHQNHNEMVLSFRTNFRLDRDESLQGMVVLLATLMGVTVVFGLRHPAMLLLLGFGLIMMYGVALRLYNRTQIKIDDSHIHVSRAPLPSPFQHTNSVTLYDVVSIHYEETEISQKEKYDTPRYRVYTVSDTGKERLIINDVIEDYAVYIAQQLEEYLHDGDVVGADAIDADMLIINANEHVTSRLADEVDNYEDDTYEDDVPSLGHLVKASKGDS